MGPTRSPLLPPHRPPSPRPAAAGHGGHRDDRRRLLPPHAAPGPAAALLQIKSIY
jgi:hypothetical protein